MVGRGGSPTKHTRGNAKVKDTSTIKKATPREEENKGATE